MKLHTDWRATRLIDVFEFGNGQLNVSIIEPGTIVAFHKHKRQTDRWIVLQGKLEALVIDSEHTDNAHSYILTPGMYMDSAIPGNVIHDTLNIMQGYWHGYRALGHEPVILMYYVTRKYDPKNPDEQRITPEELGITFDSKIK